MTEEAPSPRFRSTRAFAPGHLTAVFSPVLAPRDPRARGSTGAGLTLELGAWAEARFSPGRRARVTVRGSERGPLPISTEVARRLLRGRKGTLEVDLRHELPVGQGFGMSAAGSLATALAVAELLGIPRQRAVETAHLADLFGGGGLGGVSAILGGGLELRERAGVPPWGRVRHARWPGRVYVSVLGPPIPSPPLLSDPGFLGRVRRAAGDALRRLDGSFDAPSVFAEAERFGTRLAFAPPPLAEALRRLRRTGTWAAQAMFGGALFAFAPDPSSEGRLKEELEALGHSALALRSASRGAHTLTRPHGPVRGRQAF